ncbi:MAG: molybdate ABC transporter permease subunit [Bacteroidota bacterium]
MWEALILSGELAIITTVLLLLICLPLIFGLMQSPGWLRSILNALLSLPLVLPPTVLGFYLLIAFRPEAWLGARLNEWFGLSLVFSFPGLVVGSILYSLPFMANPVISALRDLPDSFRETAYVLGKSPWTTYRRVLLPNVKTSILIGAVMSFAHTLGEFGVVLMIGGNIAGETRVASIAIYDEVEGLNFALAHQYALTLLLISLLILIPLYWFQHHQTSAS